MSVLGKLIGQRPRDTRETLAKELLTKSDLFTKTDIPKPLALAVADTLSLYFMPKRLRNKQLQEIFRELDIDETTIRKLTPGQLMWTILYFYRINAISKNRKSRGEFVTALQQAEYESDVAKRRIEKMFGLSAGE
jgi:hypothetical protein